MPNPHIQPDTNNDATVINASEATVSDASAQSDTLLPGTILRGPFFTYRIEKVLGQGSFGITYRAVHLNPDGSTGSRVAVKEFFMSDINGRKDTTVTSGSKGGVYAKYRHKFIGEAKNLAKLDHPNIIRVHESFEANNTCYYSMDYIDGGSLDDLIKRKHHLSEEETFRYTRQIASALEFMHQNNMLHLDLKPGNIMIRDGEAVLIDFGLSKQYDENGKAETSTTAGAGTEGYAPLEQANCQKGSGGKFPATMDIYALGATMFKMLTGRRPGSASDVFNNGFPRQELSKYGVSYSTRKLIEKAMKPRTSDRIQNMQTFLRMLNSAEKNYNEAKAAAQKKKKNIDIESFVIYTDWDKWNKVKNVIITGVYIVMALYCDGKPFYSAAMAFGILTLIVAVVNFIYAKISVDESNTLLQLGIGIAIIIFGLLDKL